MNAELERKMKDTCLHNEVYISLVLSCVVISLIVFSSGVFTAACLSLFFFVLQFVTGQYT